MKRFSRFGRIKKVVWPMLHDKRLNRKRPKGFAYVVFKNPEDSDKVIGEHEKGGIYLAGFPESKLGIDRKRDNTALTKQMREKKKAEGAPLRDSSDEQRETETEKGPDGKMYIKNMVFIGSIPHTANREDIESMFSKYGKIKKIVWPQTIDRTLGIRRHKGFAYVIFFQHEDSLKAVNEAGRNGGKLCLPNLPNEPMAVERKLDRPIEGEAEGNNVSQDIDFADMYERELVKNHKLQRIIKAQQTHIRQLEQNCGNNMSQLRVDTNSRGNQNHQNQAWGQGGNSWRSNRSSRFTIDSVTAVNQMAARQAVRSPRSGSRSSRSDSSMCSLQGSGKMVIPPISIQPPTQNLRFPKPTYSPRFSRGSGSRSSPMPSNGATPSGNRSWRPRGVTNKRLVDSGNELTISEKLRQELTRNSAVDLRSSKPSVSPRLGRSPARSRSPSPPSPRGAKAPATPKTYSAFGSKEVVSRDNSPTGLLNLHEMLFSQPG